MALQGVEYLHCLQAEDFGVPKNVPTKDDIGEIQKSAATAEERSISWPIQNKSSHLTHLLVS